MECFARSFFFFFFFCVPAYNKRLISKLGLVTFAELGQICATLEPSVSTRMLTASIEQSIEMENGFAA